MHNNKVIIVYNRTGFNYQISILLLLGLWIVPGSIRSFSILPNVLQCCAHDCFTDQDAQIDQQKSIDGPIKRNAHLSKSSRDLFSHADFFIFHLLLYS